MFVSIIRLLLTGCLLAEISPVKWILSSSQPDLTQIISQIIWIRVRIIAFWCDISLGFGRVLVNNPGNFVLVKFVNLLRCNSEVNIDVSINSRATIYLVSRVEVFTVDGVSWQPAALFRVFKYRYINYIRSEAGYMPLYVLECGFEEHLASCTML